MIHMTQQPHLLQKTLENSFLVPYIHALLVNDHILNYINLAFQKI